jgi:hypothetical protein
MGKRAENKRSVVKKKLPKLKVNNRGGAYVSGASYSIDMQARFHLQLEELKEEGTGKPVTSRALAAAAMISHTTALKVVLDDKKGVIGEKKPRCKPGMGSKSLSLEDELFLLSLYRLQPSTSLNAYVKALFDMKGTKVSRATLSRW